MSNKHPLIQLTICLLGLIVLMTATITACNRDKDEEVVHNDFENLIETPSVNIDGNDLKIRYSSLLDNDLYLVYDQEQKQVRLQVDSDDVVWNDPQLRGLVEEVVWLTTTVGSSPLGDTGYYFTYEGQFPIWGIQHRMDRHGSWNCLIFAEDARIDLATKTIYAIGRKDEFNPENFYPEDLAAQVAKTHGKWLDE